MTDKQLLIDCRKFLMRCTASEAHSLVTRLDAAIAAQCTAADDTPSRSRAKRIAIERAAQPAAQGEAVAWPNHCDVTIPRALRYLADHDRPSGGAESFNSEHLLQLADEIERMASKPLYTHPPQQQGEVVVTTTPDGRCVAVTRQDDEHRILSVIWEAKPEQQARLTVTDEIAKVAFDAWCKHAQSAWYTQRQCMRAAIEAVADQLAKPKLPTKAELKKVVQDAHDNCWDREDWVSAVTNDVAKLFGIPPMSADQLAGGGK